MPKLTEAQLKGDDVTLLNPWPFPHFRLDQGRSPQVNEAPGKRKRLSDEGHRELPQCRHVVALVRLAERRSGIE
jgi:hypothetical protein